MWRRVLLLVVSIGCDDREPRSLESCEGMDARCLDGVFLQTCDDHRWVDHDCDDVCTSQQADYAFGCLRLPDADDACNCKGGEGSGPDTCDPGQPDFTACAGPRVLLHCVAGELAETPCADVCGDASDVGCFHDPQASVYGCTCVAAGDACDPIGYPTCVQDELLECVDGVWTLLECAPCPDGSNACGTDVLGVGACRCA